MVNTYNHRSGHYSPYLAWKNNGNAPSLVPVTNRYSKLRHGRADYTIHTTSIYRAQLFYSMF